MLEYTFKTLSKEKLFEDLVSVIYYALRKIGTLEREAHYKRGLRVFK